MPSKVAYRTAIAVAIGAALFLLWGMAALGVVGMEGDPADLMYFGVLAIGISGAIVARFQPDGMPRAMFVTAAAIVLVGVIALLLGKQDAEYSSVFEILGLTGDVRFPLRRVGVVVPLCCGTAPQRRLDIRRVYPGRTTEPASPTQFI